jgi:hypothetical protein
LTAYKLFSPLLEYQHSKRGKTVMTNSFDFDNFRSYLYDASKAGFLAIQGAHTNEHFYSFALVTSGDMAYVYPTASTEEGLTQAAQKYIDKGRKSDKGKTLEQMRDELRWSLGDSYLNMEDNTYFEAVNALVANISDIIDEFPEDSWDEFDTFVAQFMGVCTDVLKRLDSENVFGAGEQRDAITLNILMGDQSDDEMRKYAKLLNAASVYERFCMELASQA